MITNVYNQISTLTVEEFDLTLAAVCACGVLLTLWLQEKKRKWKKVITYKRKVHIFLGINSFTRYTVTTVFLA